MILNPESQRYEIGGIAVSELAECYGTPLFVYDSAKIISQYHRMKNALSGVKNLKINYACKALNNISILKLMKQLGTGLDAVSYQEICLGMEAGFEKQDIVYTPNSVGVEEMEAAIKLGVKVNVDNIEMLEYMGHHHPNYPFCIRINPHIMAGGNAKISVGHIDSKFGISIHQLPLVERLVSTLNINVEGVHMHTGSDIYNVEVFLQAAEILFNVARKFDTVQYIDLGSGFKVKYRLDDIETDIESFGEEMSLRFNEFCAEIGRDLTLMFEPGKFLVSESGYFLAKTNVVKQTISTIFAGIDSGFNHMIRPMFYDAYHQIINASNPEGKPKIYTIVGYICETDTFGYNRKLEQVREGDILVFLNAGAYCSTMASNYNSRYRPAEVLVHNGKAHLIRKRENMQDLLHNQIMVDLPMEELVNG
jgi:diaminopimelate decarboxylase